MIAGPQFRVDALDPTILLQELQLFLQGVERHRRPDAKCQPVAQIGGIEPSVALDVDTRQFPFDNLYREDLERYVLVRDDRAGGQIALVDVEEGQRQPEPFEILGRQHPVYKRDRDLGELGIREHGTADNVDVMD